MKLWLTRIQPNLRNRHARRDLANAVAMHRRMMMLFPDGIGPDARRTLGVLFRVDNGPAGPTIILQSRVEPDLRVLHDSYGTAATKSLSPLLDALAPNRPVHYRIAASAVRKPGRTTREAYGLKPVVPLNGPAAEEWWVRQAESSGLTPHSIHTIPLDAAQGERGEDKHQIRHARTLFDGTALITDPDVLRQRVVDGIGRGKAYGCGLLSLAPATAPR